MQDSWIWESCDCPLCGASWREAVRVHEFAASCYYRCAACRLVYLNPRLTRESMTRLYQSESYYSGGEPLGYETYEEDLAAYRATFERRYREIWPFKPGGRALDIGCGTGVSVEVASSLGYEAHGLDVSDYASGVARQRLGQRIRTGTLGAASYPDGHFDLVTMFDLFEHLYDPTRFAGQLARVTAGDGIVAIATPNYESWMRRVLGSKCVSFKIPEHVSYYDPGSLERAVAGAFRIVHVRPIGQYCTAAFLGRRLAALSRALGWLYRITLGWTGWQPYVPSGSMLAVLKKKGDWGS